MSEVTEPVRSGTLRALPLITIAVVAIVGGVLLGDLLQFELLAENREALLAYRDSHYLGAALAFFVVYVGIVAFSLPGATIATLAGGFLFGTFPGVFLNVAAASLGATLIFLAARRGLGERMAARMDAAEGSVKRLKMGIDDNQWEMLFLMRLMPVVPFWIANIVPAMVAVPLLRYVVTTVLGIIPGALVYTGVGAGLGDVIAAGETPDLGVIFEPAILLPILGLCVLAALPILFRAVRGAGRGV